MEQSPTIEQPKRESDRAQFWLDRIQNTQKFRDDTFDQIGVPRFIEYYYGNYNVKLAGMPVPDINEVYAYVESLIAQLFVRDPYVAVNAKNRRSILSAKIMEQMVNYEWRELKIKREVEYEIIDSILTGAGWHKNGYSSLAKNQDGLYSSRVSWKDMLWNVGAMNPPFDCRWMAQRIVLPLESIQDQFGSRARNVQGGPNPHLGHAAKSVGISSNKQLFSSYGRLPGGAQDIQFGQIWEIWDAQEKQVMLVAQDQRDERRFLKDPEPWTPYLDEFPFNRLFFSLTPDQPFPMPDIAPWEPQILEQIKLLAMLLNHVKRWNRQLIVREGAIDLSEEDKLERGVDGAFIKVKVGNQKSIQDVVTPLQYAAFQPEVFSLLGILTNLKNQINGMPAIEQGGTQKTTTRTLGELRLLSQSSRGRTDRKQDQIETHVENIARHLIAHMQGQFDLEKTVKVTGLMPEDIIRALGDKFDPRSRTIRFSKEDIQGEFDVEVKAGSTLPLNKENRTALLELALKAGAQMAAVPVIPPFLQVVIRELLDEFDIQSLQQAFEQQTKQAAQQQQQETMAKGVEVAKTAAEADKRRAQAEQVRSETATEGANALLGATQAGFLPEAIEFGRGVGQFPTDTDIEGGG